MLFAAVGTSWGVTLGHSFTIFALIPVITCAIVIAVAIQSMLGSVDMAAAEFASFVRVLYKLVTWFGSPAVWSAHLKAVARAYSTKLIWRVCVAASARLLLLICSYGED